MRVRCLPVLLSLVLPASLSAQAQTVIALDRPDAVLSEPFSLIRGVRELPDGRVLLSDWIEERLAVVDLARGVVRDLGRTGAGPGEFRLPGALLPFCADSTLVLDVGNGRLLVVGPDGGMGRAFQPAHSAAASPVGADATGRLYFIIPAWMARPPLPGDSVEVVSWHPEDASPRAVTRIHGSTPPPSNFSAGPRIPFVVFASQDAVAVAPDGRMAIVRGGDYHVDWLEDGRMISGPPYAGRPVRASAAERTAYARRFLQSSPMSGRGEGGGLGHTPADAQTDAAVAEVVRNTTFAETLPHFRSSELRIDGSGRLWVGRWLADGEADIHDVFDARGTRIASVRLPAERRLVALGRAAVYLVREDDTGLQTLERYAMPAALTAR